MSKTQSHEAQDVILMMLQFCQENNLTKTLEAMESETGVSLTSLDHSLLETNWHREQWDLVLQQCSKLPLKLMINLHEMVIMDLALMGDSSASFLLFTHSDAIKQLEKSDLQRYVNLKHFTKYPTPTDLDKKKSLLLSEIKHFMSNSTPSKLLKMLKNSVQKVNLPLKVEENSQKSLEKTHTIKFGKKSFPTCCVFARSFLVIGTNDGFVEVWSVQTGKHADLPYQLKEEYMMHPVSVSCVDFSDPYIASGDQAGLIKLWDLEKGNCMRKIQAFSKPVLSISFSPDGTKMISTASTIKIHGLQTGSLLKEFIGHQSFVNDAKFLNENVFVSVSSDFTMKFWNLNNSECLQSVNFNNTLFKVKVFANTLFVGEASIHGYMVDPKTREVIKTYEGDQEFVYSDCNSTNMIGVTENGVLNVFDIKTGGIVAIVNTDHLKTVSQIQISENNIATVSMDGTCQIWKF